MSDFSLFVVALVTSCAMVVSFALGVGWEMRRVQARSAVLFSETRDWVATLRKRQGVRRELRIVRGGKRDAGPYAFEDERRRA